MAGCWAWPCAADLRRTRTPRKVRLARGAAASGRSRAQEACRPSRPRDRGGVSVRFESAPVLPIAMSFAVGIILASWLTPAPLLIWVVAGSLLTLAGGVLLLRQDRLATVGLLGRLVGLRVLRGGARAPAPSGPSGNAGVARELRRSRSASRRSSLPASRPHLPAHASANGVDRGTDRRRAGSRGPGSDTPPARARGLLRRDGSAAGRRARAVDDLRRSALPRRRAENPSGGSAPSSDRIEESRRLRLPGAPASRGHLPRRERPRRSGHAYHAGRAFMAHPGTALGRRDDQRSASGIFSGSPRRASSR